MFTSSTHCPKGRSFQTASHAHFDLNFCMNTLIFCQRLHTVELETVECTCFPHKKQIPQSLSLWRHFICYGMSESHVEDVAGSTWSVWFFFLLLQYFWVCTGCFSFFKNWILSATTVSVLLPVLICSVQLDDVPSFKKTDCIILVLQSGKPEKCQACLVESKVLSRMATFTTWVGEMKVTV